MKKGTRGEARTHVSAPPERLYDMVSDVTRMPEWSPETTHCQWIGGATGPEVVAAEPGREFAFVSNLVGLRRPMTKWTYRFEAAADSGTNVTESFEMVNDLPWYIKAGDRYALGIKDRKADLEAAMQQTLERIKAVAEGNA